MDGLCSMTPNSDGFRGYIFTAKFGMRAAGYALFFWLVGGKVTEQCSSKLMLSQKLPPSPG